MNFFADLLKAVSNIAPDDTATNLDVFGQSFKVGQSIVRGLDMKAAADYQAQQLRNNAGQDAAEGQHAAANEERRTAQLMSRQLAVAAASGGGASDPTVMNIIANTASEGAYRQALALYSGNAKAQKSMEQADAVEYTGKSARTASLLDAVGGVVGVGARAKKAVGNSLLSKYGGDGPPVSNWAN